MDRRRSSIILFCIVFTAGLIFYINVLLPKQRYYYSHHVDIHGIYLLTPVEVKDFSLIDTGGKEFTKNNLKGHWTLLYFGFTRCSVVCPIAMSELNKMYVVLQKKLAKKDLPQVIFVTIDPDGDSLKHIDSYTTAFNPHFIGVRGTIASTHAIEKQLHVITTQAQGIDTLNHSADILLINPEANLQAYFTYPQHAVYMAKEYRSILSVFARQRANSF